MENEFYPEDASCLWVCVDPYGEKGKFLINFSAIAIREPGCASSWYIDKNRNIFTDDLVEPQTIQNPYITLDPFDEKDDEQVKKFDDLVQSFNIIFPQIRRYTDKGTKTDQQRPVISRDRLTVLADAMGEKPLFLFPGSEASCLNVEKNNPNKQLPDELKAWMLHDAFSLHEATCLAIGADPSYINSSDDPNYTAISTAIKKAIMHNALSATIDSCDYSTQCDPFTHDITYKEWGNVELLKCDLVRWFAAKGYKTDFFSPCETSKRKELEEHAGAAPYSTPLMQLMNDAAAALWQGVDPTDRRAPTNENVADWLEEKAKERGLTLSGHVKKVMATILRHPDKP